MKFLKQNAIFFSLFSLFLLIGAILLAITKKGDSIVFFCENRTEFGNFFFIYGTQIGEGFAYIFAFLLLLFIRFKDALLVPVVALSTLLLSFVLKSIFALPRPKNWFEMQGRMDEINFIMQPYIGNNSFPSGHTMSGFAMFGFLAFVLSRKNPIWGFVFFIPALIVAVSRVYLVNHFLMDIYLGSIVGVLIAFGVFMLSEKVKVGPLLDKNLLNFRQKQVNERA